MKATLLLCSLIFVNAVLTAFAYYDFSAIQLRNSNAPTPQCSPLKYACMSGDCIPGNYRCDDIEDCPNGGDDEDGCICADNEFQCLSNECIDESLMCNGHFDCPSAGDDNTKTGEDELFCTCPDDRILCPLDGNCIKPDEVCDEYNHCDSGSDEINCSNVGDNEEYAALVKLFQEVKKINLVREAYQQHEKQLDKEILNRLKAKRVLN